MSQGMHIFLFGDQTYDFVPDLRQLLRTRNKPILNAFLEQSHFVIRAQMNLWLPAEERQRYRTSTLAHLLQKYCDGELSPAFQVALHSVSQLGNFISHYEEVGKQYPRPGQTYLVGLCTGALPAAAISSSGSLSELLPAAIHTVQVALRLGLHAVDLRDRIQLPEAGSARDEWSAVFFGVDESAAAAAIEDFSSSEALPNTSRPWIGATAGKATTISAPPSVLQKFRHESPLSKYKSKNIPIFLPSHTSHLFATHDVEVILQTTSVPNWTGFTAKLPVISGATGKTAWAGGFVSLLERALCECLLEPIRWDSVLESFPGLMRSKGVESIVLTPIATNLEQSMSSSLNEVASVEIEKISLSDPPLSQSTSAGKSKLAIVGMSGRFPEAQSPQAFWDLLHQGLDVCKEVPKKRWDWETHTDLTGKSRNKGVTKWGCWLEFADQFDPRYFNISPKEAPQMDPAQRMALMSTVEAMEQAGIVSNTTPSTQNDRVGVFHGCTSNDYLECNSGQDIDTYFITGGNRGFIPGRINFCFEFCGPSFTNDTACSSSLGAIHLACNSLWRGDCDTAIAGGTNMIYNPDGHTGLDKGFFLSSTGNCKTFDDKADGYCRAEGVGTVFIKRLDDALAEKDPILAVILDTKTNHSAMSDSMTRPHVGAQIDNMNAVLNEANIDPKTLSYIEMHGTGTQVGDAVEMDSVLNIFAPNESFRGADIPLHVGSAKANIGHGEGVSGMTSLAKVLLMMKNDTIPPHCGIKPGSKINHNYPDLGARNVHIASQPVPWKRGAEPRRVLINNFSAAGGNTALLLEDAPISPPSEGCDPRTNHIVAVSGHVVPSLKLNLERLIDYIDEEECHGLSLPQLSWTTTSRRAHRLFRIGVTGSTIAEIKQKLQEALSRGDGTTRAKNKPKMLFTFTGQGSQFMGMGKALFDGFPSFESDLQQFDKLARTLGFPSFLHVFMTEDGDIDSNPPVIVQLATASLQIALARLMKSFGIEPSAVAGHSLGEYAALNVAGVLTMSDTLFLVGKRAELLQEGCERGTHSMLAIKASQATIASMLTDVTYEIACVNGPEDTVISGDNEQIEAAKTQIATNGLKSILLKVPFAFHSAQVQPILQSFETAAAGITFRKPSIPVLCPLLGEIVEDGDFFSSAYLARHCRETVDMAGALEAAYKAQVINDKTFTLEMGPQPVVCGMVKATLGPQMTTLPIIQRRKNVWQNITAAFQTLYNNGQDINWVQYHAPFKAAHRVLELPAYGWDLKEYHIAYEGDWCLYKPYGKPGGKDYSWDIPKNKPRPVTPSLRPIMPKPVAPKMAPTMAKNRQEIVPKQATPRPVSVPKPDTSTVHKVIEEDVQDSSATLVYETDLTRPDASRVAQGHVVNNIPFCTPSVFADMAFVLGNYLVKRFFPGESIILDVCDMVAEKVLIPHFKGPQPVRTSVKLLMAPNAERSAKCEFYSVNAKGMMTAKHAWCTIYFRDNTQLRELQSNIPHYASKIKRLHDGVRTGELLKYTKNSGYELMSTVAQFHPDYKLLDEAVLDEESLEACCTMDFSTVKPGGNFAAHPAYIDGITQVGGFAVNAKDTTDLSVEVFISHGWESLQVYEEMKTDRKYDIYVKMTSESPEFYHGDTIVLDGSRPIVYFKGVTVRRVDRKTHRLVMSAFVNKDKTAATQKATPPANKASIAAASPEATPPANKAPIAAASPKAIPPPSKAPKPATEKATQPASRAPIAKTASPVKKTPETNKQPVATKAPAVQAPIAQARPKITAPKPTPPEPRVAVQKSVPAQPIKATKPAVKKVIENKKITEALEIISEESGISTAELTDESAFADIGVDSLLSMVIGSRFREELDLELDADFKIFVDCPTVKQLKSFLANLLGDAVHQVDDDQVVEEIRADLVSINEETRAPTEENDTSAAPEATSSLATVTINSEESGNVVPAAEPGEFDSPSDAEPPEELSEVVVVESTPSKKDVLPPTLPDNALVSDALAIISDESGIAVDDLSDDSNFADVGVDSLLSMVIGSRFREELGLDLDADFSIFVNCPTVKDLKLFLAGNKGTSSEESSDYNDGSSPDLTTPEESDGEVDKPADQCKPATSVILQGVPKTAAKTVFLLPDGSGSASSYVQVPRLKGNLAVVGINSPYVREPENMNCTPSGLINSYVNEITRRQPSGPYHLGGWSSGGAFAFACAEALLKQGQEVHSLIIIDSPLPQVMERLPVEFYEFCGQIGLFGEATPPDYLIPHFTRTVDVMLPYKATPLKTRRMPKVGILWACNTVMDEKHAPKIKKTHFMTKKRQEFGPDGWETVLPGAEFVLDRAIGANHFTMMQKDHVQQVSKLIERVVAG